MIVHEPLIQLYAKTTFVKKPQKKKTTINFTNYEHVFGVIQNDIEYEYFC